MSSVIDYLRRATEFLRERGVANPRLDAEVLLADVLDVDRVGVYLNHDRPLSEQEVALYREALRRRGQREPLQHIRGRQEFFSREFLVDSRVLVPRPETELLVEAALEFLSGSSNPGVLEVGCGSGVIAITIALERVDANVNATDISQDALVVAEENARCLGANVEFRAGDLLGSFIEGSFDLIVSNPPYVKADEIETLDPEVRDFEPRSALDGGPDGLGILRELYVGAPRALAPGGALAVEIGAGQGQEVVSLAAGAGLIDVQIQRDLAGLDRVVIGKRAA